MVFTMSTNDATEGLANPSIFVLAPDNWNVGKWITITGMSDTLLDGDIEYLVSAYPIVSDDKDYLSQPTKMTTLTNADDPGNKVQISVSVQRCITSSVGSNSSAWGWRAKAACSVGLCSGGVKPARSN